MMTAKILFFICATEIFTIYIGKLRLYTETKTLRRLKYHVRLDGLHFYT